MGREAKRHGPQKLTKTVVEAVTPPKAGRLFIRDTELRGFGLQVTPNGRKTFFLERRLPGQKDPRRVTLGHYPDLRVDEARKQALDHAAKIAKNENPVADKRRAEAEAVTLGKAVAAYLAGRDLKPRTVRDVNAAMKDLGGWQDRRLLDLTPDAVQRKHRELSKASPARANLTMRYLRAVWNHASAATAAPDGTPVLPPSPVARLSALKAWNRVDRRKTVVKKADLRPWFQAVLKLPRSTPRDFLQTVILTGLRRSEALGLTWDQVDLEEGTLTVTDTKARRDHTLPLGTYLRDLLKARKKKAAGPLVFADKLGRPYSNVRYALDAVEEASGVSFCIHDLRRTFATVAESLDVSAYAVKRLLNHATAGDVTAGYLAESFDTDRLRGPMQRIEDTILRLGGVKGGAEVVRFPGPQEAAAG
ncbi:MAG: integrase family protein [Thermodesulfobacteriota bacterium]